MMEYFYIFNYSLCVYLTTAMHTLYYVHAAVYEQLNGGKGLTFKTKTGHVYYSMHSDSVHGFSSFRLGCLESIVLPP